jgi:hypothetical protein
VLEEGMYAYGPARLLFIAFEEPIDAFPTE